MEEANDNTKEMKKQEKKELKDNNSQSNKQNEIETEEKRQLPITRNENSKRKDSNKNRENTKKQ